MLRAALALSAAALIALPAGALADNPALRAGAADITPPTSSPMFKYTSRSFVFSPDTMGIDDAEPRPPEIVGPFPVLGAGVISENQCNPAAGANLPGQDPKMPLVGGPGIAPDTFPVSFWKLGDLGVVSFPAEITKQMGQRLRDDFVARSEGAFSRVALSA